MLVGVPYVGIALVGVVLVGVTLVGEALADCFRPPGCSGVEIGVEEGEKNLRARPMGERLRKLESRLGIPLDRGEPALRGLSEAFRRSSPLEDTPTPPPAPTPVSMLLSPPPPPVRKDVMDRRERMAFGGKRSPALELAEGPGLMLDVVSSRLLWRSSAF